MTDETKNDGGPAFPAEGGSDSGLHANPGMTVRDWFAGQAIGALIEVFDRFAPEVATHENMAQDAYKLADAMLEARSK